MGKGGGDTQTRSEIPEELAPLYRDTAQGVRNTQRAMPLTGFLGESGVYETAPRSGQFGLAEQGIGAARGVAERALQSRGLLNMRPRGTEDAQRTAAYAQQAAGRVPGTFGDVWRAAEPRIQDLIGVSQRQVTGENIQGSPSYQAAIEGFNAAILPQIQNSAAMSGLGRTTGLQQAIASSQAQYMLPVIQEELAREERGIGRELGARQFGIGTSAGLGLEQAQAQERGIARDQAARQFLAGTQQFAGQQDLERYGMALGADERSRALQYDQAQNAINQRMQLGQSEQQYAQGARDRATQEYLRRQGLAEQALYQPFGSFVPSTIGQSSTSSGKKGK